HAWLPHVPPASTSDDTSGCDLAEASYTQSRSDSVAVVGSPKSVSAVPAPFHVQASASPVRFDLSTSPSAECVGVRQPASGVAGHASGSVVVVVVVTPGVVVVVVPTSPHPMSASANSVSDGSWIGTAYDGSSS